MQNMLVMWNMSFMTNISAIPPSVQDTTNNPRVAVVRKCWEIKIGVGFGMEFIKILSDFVGRTDNTLYCPYSPTSPCRMLFQDTATYLSDPPLSSPPARRCVIIRLVFARSQKRHRMPSQSWSESELESEAARSVSTATTMIIIISN